ncbi:MAG: DNA recombination protein RmuC, partial [Steroidobacter sp.]
LGRNLSNSVDHYNSAVGSLERQVLPGARKFTELGVRPDREIEQLEPIDKLAREPMENGERKIPPSAGDDSGSTTNGS